MRIFRFKWKILNFWLDVALISAAVAVLLYMFFWPVRITGNSMSPVVNAGDQIVVSRILGFFNKFSAGDLVLVGIDLQNNRETIVKRIVGEPFDHVVIIGSNLYINGQAVSYGNLSGNNMDVDVVLREGEYFLLGDNGIISRDSRHFGPVFSEQILARAILRYFPLNSITIY